MAKQNRGKALSRLPSNGRGTCPACYTTRTKLIYKRKTEQGAILTVCKRCTSVPVEQLKQPEMGIANIPYRRKHRATFNKRVHAYKHK